MNDEKEVIEGYEVRHSIEFGNRRVIFAVHPDEKEEMPYLKCISTENGLVRVFESAVVSDNYDEIMKLFADDVKAEAIILENERRAINLPDVSCIKRGEIPYVGYDVSLIGQVVAIDKKHLNDGFKDIAHQLFYVTGGNGAQANARGSACFCVNLYTGNHGRIERYQVIGIVPEDKLPDFAKKTVEKERIKNTREER